MSDDGDDPALKDPEDPKDPELVRAAGKERRLASLFAQLRKRSTDDSSREEFMANLREMLIDDRAKKIFGDMLDKMYIHIAEFSEQDDDKDARFVKLEIVPMYKDMVKAANSR